MRGSSSKACSIAGSADLFRLTINAVPQSPFLGECMAVIFEPLEARTVLSVGAIPTVPSPAAYWSFDEASGSAADSSGNGRTATIGAGVSRVTGDVGAKAIAVNGTAAGAATAAGPVVNTASSFTVSAWVKLASVGGYQTVVSINGTNVSGFYLGLRGDTGTFSFARLQSDVTGGAAVAAASSAPLANTWYHLVGVDDVGAGTLTLYVDGRAEGRAAYIGGWQSAGDTKIGQALYGGSAVDYVNGAIDDVSFYASALSAAQVAALDQPAAYSFDDDSGTAAVDVSGHGNALTLGSGASWTGGRLGSSAITLNGTSTGIASRSTPVINTSRPFSVSAWVRLTNLTGYQTFVSTAGTVNSGFFLQLRGDTGKFAFTRESSDTSTATGTHADALAAPAVGTWYNLVGVNDVANGRLLLYVNGILQSSTAYTAGWQATGATVVRAGKYNGTRTDFVTGSIDDVRFYNSALTGNVAAIIGTAGGSVVDINTASAGVAVSPDLFGAFMEDINYGGEGGIYNDEVRNGGFNDSTNALNAWTILNGSGVAATLTSDATTGPTTALSKSGRLTITSGVTATSRAALANTGFFGVGVAPSTSYAVEFYAKASSGFTGPLTVSLESNSGTIYASATVAAIGLNWSKYTATLTINSNVAVSSANRFVISTSSTSANGKSIWLGAVHVFPPSYRGITTNHLRTDLMAKLAALKPGVFRVPGGNYLEGNTYADRFQWSKTVGRLEDRPGHFNSAWGYWSSDGMGLDEYLQMAEEVNARPILAVYAGYNLQGNSDTGTTLAADVTDAVNELHYVLDPAASSWGALRATNGHAAPYGVQEVEIGNEDFFSSTYSTRYSLFYDAIHAAFPSLKIIATHTDTGGRPYDVLDEHYYNSPQWFQSNFNYFNGRPRGSTKVMVGEYAANQGNPTNNLTSALGDATFMLGMMKNSDLVSMSMYAPIWANVNGIQWSPDLIGFDNNTSYGSPTYYAQTMLANNHGNTVISSTMAGNSALRTLVTRTGTTYYLTVINVSAGAIDGAISLAGVSNVSPTATMTTMSSAFGTDTNTITDPMHIAPATSTVTGLGTSFTRTFSGNSITILKFAAGSGTLDTAAPAMTSASSVKTSGAGELAIAMPITGKPGVESRAGGITNLVVTFDEPVVLGSSFHMTLANGTGSAAASGNRLILSLSGVADAQTLRVDLTDVGDTAGNFSAYSITANVLQGDITGDTKVDFNDFLVLQNAFGTVAGTAGYSTASDLNGNGSIDFDDFLLLQNAFGHSI